MIGIIRVLVGMLMPALNQARRQARSVKCLPSLRSLGQAFAMYAQNNHGFYPDGGHDTLVIAVIQQRWKDRLVPYVRSTRDSKATTGKDYLQTA